jgi:3-hydroxyisobutyrate dehydrogenase and related beta-hydroxyacid dehydrogenases
MKVAKETTTIGFVGTGVMGKSMAAHLVKAGYRVTVYNRTKAKAQELLDQGANWAANVADLAAGCQVIITMIGYPKDVEEIYLGTGGLIANAQPDACLVDMTTSSPKLAARIYEQAKAKRLYALDAPVSGGDVGAREARLAIMVGGDREAFEAVLPLFELMGSNIVLQGPAGAGQHTKMCNQIAIAGNMMGVCEAVAYAKKSGLDPAKVLESIATGAAGSWSLSNLAPRMLVGNFAPGFYIKHFIKDMRIAIEAAQEMGLDTPALTLAMKLYAELAAQGEENSGTQALFKYYIRD